MSIEDLVVHFVERYDLERPKPEQILVESWDTIFGSFSERCYPVKLTDSGTLVISVTIRPFERRSFSKKMNFCKDSTITVL